MFGMGGSEILVILIVALLFLGPDKLPDAAKKISKGIRDIKKQSRILQRTIEDDEHIGGAIRDLRSALRGEDEPIRPKPPTPKELPKELIEAAPTPDPALPAIAGVAVLAAASDGSAAIGGESHTATAGAGHAPADAGHAAADAGHATADAGHATADAGHATADAGHATAGHTDTAFEGGHTAAVPAAPTEAAPAGTHTTAAAARAEAAEASAPRLTFPPTAGEPSSDQPASTAHQDAELAALVKPAPNTIARGAAPAPASAPAETPESSEPKHG